MVKQFGPAGQNAHERKLLLRSDGPILDIVAQASENLAGLNCRGLIDTGASVNCVDNNTARKLGLTVIDRKAFQSASGRTQTPVYLGRIHIPDLNLSISEQFYGAELLGTSKSFHFLLGRLFLADFIFSYDGPEGRFLLAEKLDILTENGFDE